MRSFLYILIVILGSQNTFAFLDPRITDMIYASKFKKNIHGKQIENFAPNVTCETIKLRLSANEQLQHEISNLENKCYSDYPDIDLITCNNLLLFNLLRTNELYNVLLDTFPVTLAYQSDYLLNMDQYFSFIVSAGQVYLNFPSGMSDFNFSNNKVDVSITTYQRCFGNSMNLFIVKDCFASNFSEIENCRDNQVMHFGLQIPRLKPAIVTDRQRRY